MARTIVGIAAAVALAVALAGVVITSDQHRADQDDSPPVTQPDVPVTTAGEGWPHAAHTELFTDLAPGDDVVLPPRRSRESSGRWRRGPAPSSS